MIDTCIETSCLTQFFLADLRGWVILAALAISIASLLLVKTRKFSPKTEVALIHVHIASLFLIPIFVGLSMGCGMSALECETKQLLYAIPIAALGTFVLGYFILPYIYKFYTKAKLIDDGPAAEFVEHQSKHLGIKRPLLYLLDTAKPIAYSFSNLTSNVFISAGLADLLTKKELEAVLLHELLHVRENSSLLKFSANFATAVSPLSRMASFCENLSADEQRIDTEVAKLQATAKHVESAKKKIERYNCIREGKCSIAN